MKNVELPFWRSFIVLLGSTVAAVAFWRTYYREIRWWPTVLFGIYAFQYSYYLFRLRRAQELNGEE